MHKVKPRFPHFDLPSSTYDPLLCFFLSPHPSFWFPLLSPWSPSSHFMIPSPLFNLPSCAYDSFLLSLWSTSSLLLISPPHNLSLILMKSLFSFESLSSSYHYDSPSYSFCLTSTLFSPSSSTFDSRLFIFIIFFPPLDSSLYPTTLFQVDILILIYSILLYRSLNSYCIF